MSRQTEAFVAWVAAESVESMLRAWPSWLEDLEVSKSKLDQVSRPAGVSVSGASPAPIRFDQMWCIDEIAQNIRGLTVVLDLDLGRHVVYRPDVADAALELAVHSRWLSEAPAAVPYLERLFELQQWAERMVDLPPDDDLIFLGRCDGWTDAGRCRTDIYARPEQELVVCTECDEVTSVTSRRNRALTLARNKTARPKVIERMLKSQGVDVTAARIYQWASRKRKGAEHPPLLHAGEDREGLPVYRVADVYALAMAAAARRRTG